MNNTFGYSEGIYSSISDSDPGDFYGSSVRYINKIFILRLWQINGLHIFIYVHKLKPCFLRKQVFVKTNYNIDSGRPKGCKWRFSQKWVIKLDNNRWLNLRKLISQKLYVTVTQKLHVWEFKNWSTETGSCHVQNLILHNG